MSALLAMDSLNAATDGTMPCVEARALSQRERAVLDALLSADLEGVEDLRRQAAQVSVVNMCGCGCPSIDFQQGRGLGMTIRVNAGVRASYDGLFLYTIDDPERGELLGGIEWVGITDPNPEDLPAPHMLSIERA